MRVDLNSAAMPELDRSKGSTATALDSDIAAQKSVSSSAEVSGDVASLSTGSEAVKALKVELSGVPDIRQQLVQSLRQAVSNGTYRISPDVIAKRMLADSSRKTG